MGKDDFDFASLVEKKTKTDAKPNTHYIGPYVHDSDEWKAIEKCFGTSSPRELAQIVAGIAAMKNAGTLTMVVKTK